MKKTSTFFLQSKRANGKPWTQKLLNSIPLANVELYLRVYNQYRKIENEACPLPKEFNEIVRNLAKLEKDSWLTSDQVNAVIGWLDEKILIKNPNTMLDIFNRAIRIVSAKNLKYKKGVGYLNHFISKGAPGDPALHFLSYALNYDLRKYAKTKRTWNLISGFLNEKGLGNYAGDTLRKKGDPFEIGLDLTFVLISMKDRITQDEKKTLKSIFPALL